MARMTLGIDLHNRACLFFPRHGLDYDLGRLIDLAVLCEELGFDSVSVGDSLLAKPRWRPIPPWRPSPLVPGGSRWPATS